MTILLQNPYSPLEVPFQDENLLLCPIELEKNKISRAHSSSPIVQSAAYRTWDKEVAGWIPGLGQYSSPRIDDRHRERIHSSLTAVRCFDNGYMGRHPMAWKEYCAEYL